MDGSSAQSPIPVPPLIPLPGQQPPGFANDKDDVFATLFSPPTPRASPSRTPEPGQTRPARHMRTESTDSDFGAFVSVPAAEDPLHPGEEAADPVFSLPQNQVFFDRFTEDAKAASERNRREVLDELLQHENDPLSWMQGASDTRASRTPTPQPAQTPSETPSYEGESLIDLDSPTEGRMAKALVPPVYPNAPAIASSASSISQSIPEDTLFDFISPRDGESERESRSLRHAAAASHVRSPSLPPSSPTRISPPEIQRTPSYFSSPSFPSRMVSSLLSSAIRSSASRPAVSTPSPSGSHTDELSTSRIPPTASAVASHLAGFSRSAPHSRAATVSEGLPGAALDSSITHGSPFASHTFVPPSGAPGFTGDRKWNKGFEFDKTQVERKSVRLNGRREMTVPVLTVEIADMVRTQAIRTLLRRD